MIPHLCESCLNHARAVSKDSDHLEQHATLISDVVLSPFSKTLNETDKEIHINVVRSNNYLEHNRPDVCKFAFHEHFKA